MSTQNCGKCGEPGHKRPRCGKTSSQATYRRANVHLGLAVYEEMRAEAKRLDRSFSWLVKRAWKLSKEQIHAMSLDDIGGAR